MDYLIIPNSFFVKEDWITKLRATGVQTFVFGTKKADTIDPDTWRRLHAMKAHVCTDAPSRWTEWIKSI